MSTQAHMSTPSGSNFQVESFDIEGVKVIRPKVFRDKRGHFVETFRDKDFKSVGITDDFIQDHQSLSLKRGTVRGLHFQLPPYEQAKLVRCSRGRVYDVVVDLRVGSDTYGEHVGVELSEENSAIIYVPVGFAHGFYTMDDNCEVLYKVSAYYAPAHDGGILWNDPDLAIDWRGQPNDEIIMSEKDMVLPRLKDFNNPFKMKQAVADLATNAA